ncbi:efflux RND transporter periplasmic adaptor subunit [Roseisolibacter agri]|uniref:efflux RND transporter periplasmic adaptor subunit n=1 Tax=Roseisolibacter agri TaxID=2014610 RepID=UPI0024E16FB6|nr:efflux RND transporter periplasmic adaptor subunit [Roseisolibacter agri]
MTTVASSGLSVTGTITYDANRVSHVGARTPGRIVTLSADIGQRVRAGQTLALLESPEVGQLRADAGEADVLERIARENYARERRLEEQGISSRKELLAAEAELRRAEAARQSARERLRVLGASGGRGSQFAATAPFAGVVVARAANRGEMATPEDQLFTVADLSHVWIELDVFERDLPRVRTGQPVTVNAAAFPGRTFPGRIVYLGAVVDTARRTVRARVEIPNADGALRPGMFATARVQTGGGGPPLLVVPQEAVQEVEGRRAVFVPGDRPGQFRVVPVDVGETLDGGRVVIRTGLTPASRVVTAGAFLLRSELAKREIGEAGH